MRKWIAGGRIRSYAEKTAVTIRNLKILSTNHPLWDNRREQTEEYREGVNQEVAHESRKIDAQHPLSYLTYHQVVMRRAEEKRKKSRRWKNSNNKDELAAWQPPTQYQLWEKHNNETVNTIITLLLFADNTTVPGNRRINDSSKRK